ncbi:LamG domain-containing protein [Streptomyces sp. NBC_01318]|uniref:LamG domain-containing protein n=1 Tax=unclassified Streptomyces TaxID=2593676 RepID=UPI002E0D76AE|nr:LamG domain-containing protein [Streptomyces sp. NBC_01318]
MSPTIVTGTTAAAEETPQSQADQALAQAQALGARVEVVGERTEHETTFANPDGVTLTLEKSITPVRVAKPGGGWAVPDATLEKRPDGSIGPKASVADVTFSPGGDGKKLVTIAEEGRSVSLDWPGTLPTPQLDGPRATYANVLPDVDLIMTATVEGYRQVLEVRTPAAAASPELKQIKFALDAKGLDVRETAGGGAVALDGNGRTVFRAPAAVMWNSAGDDASLGMAPMSARAESPVPAGPAEEGDPLAGPGAGDASAVMDMSVGADAVTVTPDADLIASTDVSDFPLYIDPTVELNEDERTVLSSDGDVFYNFSDGTNGMSVGKCGSAVIGGVSYYCGNGYVNRMYFEFSPAKLAGKQIVDATFRATETWSFSCDDRLVDLVRTSNITSATKWSTKPDELDWMVDRDVSAGRGSACDPSQPRAAIEFNDSPAETNENLTPTVQAFAAGKFSRLTLELRAHDESDTVAWKRFNGDAVLSVVYTAKPATPTAFGVVAGSSYVCSGTESTPSIVSDPTPPLTATPQTASGGEAGARLRVYFDLDVKNADGTWSDAAPPSSGSLKPASGYVGDNNKQVLDWTTTLAQNQVYRYQAWTWSYNDSGSSYLVSSSTSTVKWCYFKVDSMAPKAPTVKFNGPYTPCTTNDCVPNGKPGLAGSFTFGPATGDVNTTYRYKLSTDTAWSADKAGATYTASITPPTSGTMQLHVMAKDTLGWGEENIVEFSVKEGAGPVARWNFDEASGNAIDSSTADASPGDDAVLTGASRNDNGRRGEIVKVAATETEPAKRGPDQALHLNGTGYAATTGPVVDTRAPYTVAAWVRLDTTGRNYTALGQDGTHMSQFLLGYCENVKTWCVRLTDSDTTTSYVDSQRAIATSPATTKVWTHLAAVVDTTANTLTLYVNGIKQGSHTITSIWNATGATQIGRIKYKDNYTDLFPGDIDEVAIWQDALSDIDVAKEAALTGTDGKAYTEMVANWNPASTQGATVTDDSGYERALTLSTGASLNGESLVLDGTTGAGTAPGPLVDDTGSFTVTTEAVVDSRKLAGKPDRYRAQILGQKTATDSSWSLWFEKTKTVQEPVLDEYGDPVLDENLEPITEGKAYGKWHFGRLSADGSGASVESEDEAELDSEARLTGVYDAQAGKISLYLSTDRMFEPLVYTAMVGSGDFAAGRGWLASAWGNYLPGRINDIRVWAGAMGADQIDTATGTA